MHFQQLQRYIKNTKRTVKMNFQEHKIATITKKKNSNNGEPDRTK